MKTDISNREDILILMKAFYDQLLLDKKMAYLFNDVAKIDMEKHLPIIVDFWEMVLFQTSGYQKNVMKVHQLLNEKSPITKEHFDIWLRTFNEIIDEKFEGDHVIIAKQRALSIATMMQIKMIR